MGQLRHTVSNSLGSAVWDAANVGGLQRPLQNRDGVVLGSDIVQGPGAADPLSDSLNLNEI